MNEFTLLIQDWEADVQLLKKQLRRLASQVSAPQAMVRHRYLQRQLHRARQAQVLLYNLAQAHAGAVDLAA